MPTSAVDSITLAIEHTKQQLFKPFRIGQWTALAFVGLLAGELGANGCNRSNFQTHPHPPLGTPHIPGLPEMAPALIAAAISAIIAGSLQRRNFADGFPHRAIARIEGAIGGRPL